MYATRQEDTLQRRLTALSELEEEPEALLGVKS